MIDSSFGIAVHPDKIVRPAVAVAGLGSQDIEYAFHQLERDNIGLPGGGLLSTPRDMSIWLRYVTRLYRDELGKHGPRIIESATLRDMMRGRSLAGHQIGGVPVRPGQALCKEFSVPSYALGQYRCHYRGRDMLYHWGERRDEPPLLWILADSHRRCWSWCCVCGTLDAGRRLLAHRVVQRRECRIWSDARHRPAGYG